MIELKNIQAEVYRNGVRQGGIKIKSDGTNQCDWNVLNNLTQEQRKELDNITKNLINFLEVSLAVEEKYRMVKGGINDNVKVFRKIGEEETQVGIIRRDNRYLIFTVALREGEIENCIDQINEQHLTDFYYAGCHYDGD